MMDGPQARLDRAITEARQAIRIANTNALMDHYAALVALRARLEEHEVIPCDNENCLGWKRLTAEAERLLGEDA